MTPPGLTCVDCVADLYPDVARATTTGFKHVNCAEADETCRTCHAPLISAWMWRKLTEREQHAALSAGRRRKDSPGVCSKCAHVARKAKEHAERAAAKAARIEDLTFMAEHGESLVGAAARLDLTRSALEHFLNRNGLPDLLEALTANNPHDWNKLRTADGLPTTRTPQAMAKRNANRNEKRRADRRERTAA